MMLARATKAVAARVLLALPAYWQSIRKQRGMAVLCYHRVNDTPDALDLSVSTQEFTAHMDILAESDQCETVDATRFAAIWHGKEVYGERVPVLVTFDDGYRDVVQTASPIMNARGIRSVLFVASGVLRGEPLWYDLLERSLAIDPAQTQRRLITILNRRDKNAGMAQGSLRAWVEAIKVLDAQRAREVRACLSEACRGWAGEDRYVRLQDLHDWREAGHEVGAHTRLHPSLGHIDDDAAREEMAAGKTDLESALRSTIRLFAYPFGQTDDFRAGHAAMLERLQYSMAFTTIPGLNRAGDPPLTIRRKCIHGGLFARPGASFDDALFRADVTGMGPALRALANGARRGGRS